MRRLLGDSLCSDSVDGSMVGGIMSDANRRRARATPNERKVADLFEGGGLLDDDPEGFANAVHDLGRMIDRAEARGREAGIAEERSRCRHVVLSMIDDAELPVTTAISSVLSQIDIPAPVPPAPVAEAPSKFDDALAKATEALKGLGTGAFSDKTIAEVPVCHRECGNERPECGDDWCIYGLEHHTACWCSDQCRALGRPIRPAPRVSR
jgi:hypothetical protein